VFQPFFVLEAGPGITDEDQAKEYSDQLKPIGAAVHAALASGSFHKRAHEMYYDLFAGTAAMLMMRGEDPGEPILFRTVPMSEIALEEGPTGDIWGVHWKRTYPVDELTALWPKGDFSTEIADLMKQAKEGTKPADVMVHQYTRYNHESKRYDLLVWTDKDGDAAVPLHIETMKTNPWLTPRFWVIPGEPYGRGPAHTALPFAKTLNKARELLLRKASLSLYGILTARNDGVFNPSKAKFQPAAIWTVGSNGGPMGPTLKSLELPDEVKLPDFIIKDEREQVKIASFDEALPPDVGTPKSATEIAERVKRLSTDMSGVLGRLTLEIIKPLVVRTIDLLQQGGKLPALDGGKPIVIDQVITQVRVIAPIVGGEQAGRVQQFGTFCDLVQKATGVPQAPMMLLTPKTWIELGSWLGLPSDNLSAPQDVTKFMAAAVQHLIQQMAPPPAPSAQPPQVNGGQPNGAQLWQQ
jgi:Bacteriophage head to tail connecting protein